MRNPIGIRLALFGGASLLGGLGAIALVLGAVGVLAGPSLSGIQAIGAIPVCGGCNIVVVSKDPAAANYTTVEEAMSYIASQTHDASNRWLVYIAPGGYNLPAPLEMLEYVDIQGAGEGVTSLTRGGSNTHPLTNNSSATVYGADNAELRSLTVVNTGGAIFATGILNIEASPTLSHVTFSTSGGTALNTSVYNNNFSSPIMTGVTATAFGPSLDNFAIYNCDDSDPVMTNVIAIASGASRDNFGMHNDAASPTIFSSTLQASGGTNSYGIFNDPSPAETIKIDNSPVMGGTATIHNSAGVTVRVTGSLLDGGDVAGAGVFTCLFSYNESYEILKEGTCAFP